MATQKNTAVGSVFDLPAKSWEIVKNNWQMFAVVNILSIFSALAGIFGDQSEKQANIYDKFQGGGASLFSGPELAAALGIGSVIAILFIVFNIFLYAMATSLELRSSTGEKPDFNSLFDAGKKYWLRLLGLMIVAGVTIFIGLLLFIVPGIIAIGRLIFAPYIMFDKDMGIVDSMRASAHLTKGKAGLVWAAIGVMILVSIAAGIISAIPVIGALIGTLVTIAFSLVLVLRYQEIKRVDPAGIKPAPFSL